MIAGHRHRYLRTARHPSAHLIEDAIAFDDRYETGDTFDDVYAGIVSSLGDEARRHGSILYAVPGSPLVLEATVAALRARGDLEVRIHPATSFLDLAWTALGIDPVEVSVTLIDGHRFATAAAGVTGPMLVAHTHAPWVLSDIKLAVDDESSDPEVTLLIALGTDAERLVRTTWSEMDRVTDVDHLTSLWIPEIGVPVASGYQRFHLLARTLRERCPWDVEQTHRSLIPYLIEEAYEVVDAIEALEGALGSLGAALEVQLDGAEEAAPPPQLGGGAVEAQASLGHHGGARAHRLDLLEDVGREDDDLVAAHLADEAADLGLLVGVEAVRWLVEDEDVRIVEDRLGQSDAALEALGEGLDPLGRDVAELRALDRAVHRALESGSPQAARLAAEAEQVFRNLTAVAEASGGTLNNAVKINISLTDLDDFDAVNTVMASYFEEPYPARACVQVAALPKGARIEVEAILAL